ncbi:MAG TPA: serine/threonine-protein kinase [Candidatus Obscuribacterales bacterium]
MQEITPQFEVNISFGQGEISPLCDDVSLVKQKVAAASEQLLAPVEQQLPEQYEVLGKVRQGGMGSIFKARNKYTCTTYGIKVLLPKCAADELMRKRFLTEAIAASALKHPGICQVRDFGITAQNMPYLVMDWIDGKSLQEKVRTEGPLKAEEAIPLFLKMTAALGFAHQRRVVHRDLKPDHMLLVQAENGETDLVIVDFGIAKILEAEGEEASEGLTKTGTVVGTPTYMSPEQARGIHLDQTSDIYSLACVMYFALTGTPPFSGDTYLDTMWKHINDPPPELDPVLGISQDLRAIIFRALEKQPGDRYQSMEELASDLRKLTQGDKIERHTPTHERKRKEQRWLTFAYFIGGFILMYTLSMALQYWTDPESQTAPGMKPIAKSLSSALKKEAPKKPSGKARPKKHASS